MIDYLIVTIKNESQWLIKHKRNKCPIMFDKHARGVKIEEGHKTSPLGCRNIPLLTNVSTGRLPLKCFTTRQYHYLLKSMETLPRSIKPLQTC